MSSPSGTSSGTTSNTRELKKQNRLLSNRESARRSRMRKQKHVDDLILQVINLRAENNEILRNTNVAAELMSRVEAENWLLVGQISELKHRLQTLKDNFGV